MKGPDKLVFTDFQLQMIQGLHRREESKHEYIRKDALLEWAKEKYEEYVKKMKENNYDATRWGQQNAFHQVIEKIESL